tara:strand:+ start:32578 stop:32781 length:204 start_codon:yes stop_codon:yes gene_type:complete
MDKEWIKVYSDTFEPKVEMFRIQLQNDGISALALNQKDSAHVHIGEVELFVKRDNVIRAKHLIESWS